MRTSNEQIQPQTTSVQLLPSIGQPRDQTGTNEPNSND